MDIKIKNQTFSLTLYGLLGQVENYDYAAAGMSLMDKIWAEIKEKELEHRGVNHWVYTAPDAMFVGVELATSPEVDVILDREEIELQKYAYWKHIGSYTELASIHDRMRQELSKKKLNIQGPSIEIYGDWIKDETKLETEILIGLA